MNSPDMQKDIELAKKGSSEAFARLYATVYKDLYHIALYSLKNTHDASDAVSDTVLDAFCSIHKLRDPEKFRSWIMTILSAKIKRKIKNFSSVTEEFTEELDDISEFDYDSVELRNALEKLDSQSRLILSMSVLGGYTSEEISAVCNIKSGSVRSRLSRIKEKLRLELTPDI